MSKIDDFTDSELWIIRTTLEERYGEAIEPQLVDVELRLDPGTAELTLCPAAYWERNDCHFVVPKVGDNRYRCQFYYRNYQMYGPSIEEFDDLSECMVMLLQVQADYEASRTDGAPDPV
jgi:hypothetical protein